LAGVELLVGDIEMDFLEATGLGTSFGAASYLLFWVILSYIIDY